MKVQSLEEKLAQVREFLRPRYAEMVIVAALCSIFPHLYRLRWKAFTYLYLWCQEQREMEEQRKFHARPVKLSAAVPVEVAACDFTVPSIGVYVCCPSVGHTKPRLDTHGLL